VKEDRNEMVSIEISTILFVVGGSILGLLGFFGARAFANYDRRFASHDERARLIDAKIDAINDKLNELIGEHNARTCIPRARKK